jgi:predicted O-linked N-acetylglucosamine transferase (SPINDLY family)
LKPDSADAWEDRATALAQLDRREDAIAAYDRALALNPGNPTLLYNRGNNRAILKHYEKAIRDCEDVLRIAPDYPYARGVLLHSKLQSCDWHSLAEQKTKIESDLKEGKRVCSPFNWKAVSDSPAEHRRCAELWVTHECPPLPKPLARDTRYRHDRIRLAYVSGDFNNTAVASLMAGVFEHHDRTRFEIFAVSFGSDQPTPMRRRLESAFEHFIEVRDKTDPEIAALLGKREIDIAVDLMGFTGECRPAIFAHRPAPLQVNYLGFPGTMGAPYIDYIVADPTIIPREQQSNFSEKVCYLPHCYLPADRTRAVSRAPSRAEAGLPEQGFVFASFNNSYKFNPAVFDIWMRLLLGVEGSVLWLPENNVSARRNLAREAQVRGVAPERIVFAPPVPGAEAHLARLSLTDLFLDTHPYNAHTTGIDALWAGVPLLTMLGGSFAGRVAASALKAAGLPELIAQSPPEYETMAIELARDTAKLAAVRAKLANNRLACALFDTAQFTRNLEAAFTTMWQRQQRGQPPAGFAVASAG